MFNTLEDLMAAVEERRKELLTLEVDLGTRYSPEYEEAKAELAQAKAMKSVTGTFLADTVGPLERRVAELRPEPRSIWIQFEKIDLNEWASLMKQQAGSTALDQYERIFPKVFVGVFGRDPVEPEELEEGQVWEAPEPLTKDPLSVSAKGGSKSILPGGSLHGVVQTFISWQNSGGDVTIRPTKSGRG